MTFDQFRQIISEICMLPVEKVTPEKNFRDDLGIDSLQMINLLLELTSKYGFTMSKISSSDDIKSVMSLYRTLVQEGVL